MRRVRCCRRTGTGENHARRWRVDMRRNDGGNVMGTGE